MRCLRPGLELSETGDLSYLIRGMLRLRYRMQQRARGRKNFKTLPPRNKSAKCV